MGRTRLSPKQVVAAVDSSTGAPINLTSKLNSIEENVGFIKGKVASSANLPASPSSGWHVFVEDENKWKKYNGTSWVNISGGSGGGASAVSDLTDVVLTGLNNGYALIWNSVASKWTAQAITTDGYTKSETDDLLDAKADNNSLGTAASKNTGTASGQIPVLDSDGKLSSSILPAIAITDTFEVASQNAMLALTAEKGDVAVRSDINKSFILSASPASTLANWVELKSPTDTVASVNGQTGTVTLGASDVGAEPTISSKGTAFNKDFGSTAGTVAEGNHSHTFASLTSKPTTLSGYGITDALGASSPSLTGTPTAPTANVDTNTTQIATTAFVLGQASSTTPVMDGTAAIGTSTRFARADHVHASDTSKANLASPTFTGSPAAPTQNLNDNSTKLATTEFVHEIIEEYETTETLTYDASGNITKQTVTGTTSADANYTVDYVYTNASTGQLNYSEKTYSNGGSTVKVRKTFTYNNDGYISSIVTTKTVTTP